MAIKSIVYKANLQIADIDHNYYADHALTLARHPSETDERMMVRLSALSLNAHQLLDMCQGDAVLAFGAGLSDPDDPDVALTDFTGRKRLWIEVGQPEEKPLHRACSQADHVVVYAFHHAAEVWWNGMANKLLRMEKLKVVRIPFQAAHDMAAMAERSMQLQVTVQEGAVSISSQKGVVHFEPVVWQSPKHGSAGEKT
ncbi:MAG: YaeQ family protein [Betaproteobacteria bacterium]|nr:YaeQ family protein [Betaproteobacteria bacterium]